MKAAIAVGTIAVLACATALAAGSATTVDPQTSGARRGQPAGGAAGETAGGMQGPTGPDAKAVEVRPAGQRVLGVADSPEHGKHLTDRSGRALYLLEGDTPQASKCQGECTKVWPPVLAGHYQSTARDPAVKEDKIGKLRRPDGSTQVTYNGHPLYYYAKDAGPGKAAGHDVHDKWGEWYLVSPQGTKVKEK